MSNYATEVATQNKRKKKEASPSSSSGFLHSLPDAVAITCLSNVSRLDHAALSLVSKSCRSLVVSHELYQIRSLMGYAEKFLYVCLCMPTDRTPRWFILRPTLDAATGKNVNLAHPIPSFPCQPRTGSSVVALDWGIYVIGGWFNGKRTSGVLLFDCRSHKWHQVTSMRVARVSAEARVVDGKIYVLGGCKEKNYSDWGEVFEPKTQTWTDMTMSNPILLEEKVYVVNSWNRSFYYLQSQYKLNQDLKPMNSRYSWDWCVIDKLIYSCGKDGGIYWCEAEDLDPCEAVGIYWKKVLGLLTLQTRLRFARVVHFGGKMVKVWESYKIMYYINKDLEELLPKNKLTNLGQNILVFWEWIRDSHSHKSLEIWCEEISLLSMGGREVWGNNEWRHRILAVDLLTVDPLLYNSKVLYSIPVDV